MGEAIVAKLALRSSGDTLSRWMAHHIASCMADAKTAKGDARISAEERCRRAILELWEHRAELPSGKRPLEAIEPLLATIEALDPDRTTPFYQRRVWNSFVADVPEEIVQSLSVAREADRAARLVIGALLDKATAQLDGETAPWIDLATDVGTDLGFDIHILLHGKNERARTQALRDKISLLTGLIEQAGALASEYQAELERLPNDESAQDDTDDW